MKSMDTCMEMNNEREKYLKIHPQMLENARKQFCADTCLSWEEYLRSPAKKVYIQKTCYAPEGSCVAMENARRYHRSDAFFNAIICLGQLFLTVDEAIYDWAVEQFADCEPEWFCQFGNLRKIDGKLQEYGKEIGDTHLYFLPSIGLHEDADTGVRKEDLNGLELKWYEQEEIEEFREGNRFPHALGYMPGQPDALAVAVMKKNCGEENVGAGGSKADYDQNQMAGMSGVSIDGGYLWQVGIDVDSDFSGQGLAAGLVKELSMELIRRGVTPFYGTGEAHSISRAVAYKAGYVPAFASVYAVRKEV